MFGIERAKDNRSPRDKPTSVIAGLFLFGKLASIVMYML